NQFVDGALVVSILPALRAANEIERHIRRLGGSDRNLCRSRVGMVQPLHVIPSIADGNHGRDLAGKSIGRLEAGMGKRDSIPKYEAAAEVVVIAVVPANYFISHVGGELPRIQTQPLPDRNDVADEELRNIHMVRDSSVRVAEQAIGGGNLRNPGARDQVEAEAKLFRFADRALDDQFSDIQLGIVVIEIENPKLVDVVGGNVVVEGVGEGQEAVGRDAPPPGPGIGGAGNLSRSW